MKEERRARGFLQCLCSKQMIEMCMGGDDPGDAYSKIPRQRQNVVWLIAGIENRGLSPLPRADDVAIRSE